MYSMSAGGIGARPVLNIFTPSTTQEFVAGKTMWADDPYLGGGCFVYGKAGAAMTTGCPVYLDGSAVATKLPNTANQGFPVAFARQEFVINAWGWFQVFGVCPTIVGTGVAVGAAIGITAAGQLGTNAAGKQILGVRVIGAATDTITKTGFTDMTTRLFLPNVDGLWVGQAVSGTGVASSTTISAIDPSQNLVTLSNAGTAVGSATITFTYTGFNLLRIAFPFAQGAIT